MTMWIVCIFHFDSVMRMNKTLAAKKFYYPVPFVIHQIIFFSDGCAIALGKFRIIKNMYLQISCICSSARL